MDYKKTINYDLDYTDGLNISRLIEKLKELNQNDICVDSYISFTTVLPLNREEMIEKLEKDISNLTRDLKFITEIRLKDINEQMDFKQEELNKLKNNESN